MKASKQKQNQAYNTFYDALINNTPDQLLANQETVEVVAQLLKTLTLQEESVIALRFGMNGTTYTLKEVGDIFGITQERIRQVEAKALRKLRHPIRSKHFATIF